MSERIDISVNESGAATAIRELEAIALASQGLSASLAKSLRGRALRVGINTDKAVRTVAAAVLTKVVKTTPHDTGAARANWVVNVSSGEPAVSSSREKQDYEGDATIAAGMATMSSKRSPGQTIWISNALDYIAILNTGTSLQAPSGFVQMAVMAGTKAASNINLLGE